MNILYYYYYLFYTKVLPDDEPHATVVWTLSFSESLLISYTYDFITVHFYCSLSLSKWKYIITFLCVLIFNYFFYIKTARGREIVNRKPKFLNRNILSIVVTFLFCLITSSFLLWMDIYLLYILEKCR